MSTRYRRNSNIRALLAAAMIGLTVPAMAQVPVAAPGDSHHRTSHVEGRIAHMKAELKIDDAQAKEWDAVGAAMRSTADAERLLHEEMRARREEPMTANESLAWREKMNDIQAKNAKAFTVAFTALYARMNDDQKKAADHLLSPRRHHWL